MKIQAIRLIRFAAALAIGCSSNPSMEGEGPTKNPAGSVPARSAPSEIEALRIAADGGDVKAQTDLAEAYRSGTRGVSRYMPEAYKWAYLADRSGHVPAKRLLQEIQRSLSAVELAQGKWLVQIYQPGASNPPSPNTARPATVTGWLELVHLSIGEYEEGNPKPVQSTDWQKFLVLHQSDGIKYVVELSRETSFKVKSSEGLSTGPQTEYTIAGVVTDVPDPLRRKPTLAPRVIRAGSVVQTK